MVADGLMREFKDAALLLAADGSRGPDGFAPLASAFAACALGDLAIEHNKADRLFRQVLGWP